MRIKKCISYLCISSLHLIFFFRFGNWINISTLRMSRIHHDTDGATVLTFELNIFHYNGPRTYCQHSCIISESSIFFYFINAGIYYFHITYLPKSNIETHVINFYSHFLTTCVETWRKKKWQMFHCFVFLWLMSHREISSRLKTSSLPTQVFNEEEHSFACSYTSFEQMSANFTVLTLTHISL